MQLDLKGLTSQQASQALSKFGPNKLPESPPPSSISILASQLKNPLVYVLLLAAAVTLTIGHIADTVIITLAVLINTTLGFIQEKKANNALQELKKMVQEHATVIRNGTQIKIKSEEIVPGDIVVLNTGSKIPADGKLFKINRFFVSEALLTGESLPIEKKLKDEIYMGTVVVAGRGFMIVTKTAHATKMGNIAKSINTVEEETPLTKKLKSFSKKLTVLVLSLISIVLVVGLIRQIPLIDLFTTSVALAVSAIPESLLIGLTVVLAVGMQRILKRKGLVRHLVSAETLGAVTVICTDKTGTLTEGKMKVVKAIGNKKLLAKQMLIANDLDDPIVVAANSWAKSKYPNSNSLNIKHKTIDSIPFTSSARYFASLNASKNKNILYVNGSPEIILEKTTISDKEKEKILAEIDELTQKGHRLIGLIKKSLNKKTTKIEKSDLKDKFEWVGILAFSDPPRDKVKSSLDKARQAGAKIIVITGDHYKTALSVMSQVGIETNDTRILQGAELEKLSEQQLAKRLSQQNYTNLFARTTPEQKIKIVNALKQNNEVVAMMGDGVNDAPALKAADIGIVVGEATEVAKETADLILLDSNFQTIVSAIEEGRGIYENIRKIILYLMSDAFSEIIAVVGAMILFLPTPITAAQILWINLVSDGFPDLALAVDPKRKNILSSPARDPSEPLVSLWMTILIATVSIVSGATALIFFIYYYKTTGNLELARSIAFVTLGINSLVYVFSVRTLLLPVWKVNPFTNKWLILAVLAGIVLQIIPFIHPVTRSFFAVTSLHLNHWLLVTAASLLMFITIELSKGVFNLKWRHY